MRRFASTYVLYILHRSTDTKLSIMSWLASSCPILGAFILVAGDCVSSVALHPLGLLFTHILKLCSSFLFMDAPTTYQVFLFNIRRQIRVMCKRVPAEWLHVAPHQPERSIGTAVMCQILRMRDQGSLPICPPPLPPHPFRSSPAKILRSSLLVLISQSR